MLNLTSNGPKLVHSKKHKEVKSLPENVLYHLLDYIQAGWSYKDIVSAKLCPNEHKPALKAFINSYAYVN
jgi:hypothetical protein